MTWLPLLLLLACGVEGGTIFGGSDAETLSTLYARPGQLASFGVQLEPDLKQGTIRVLRVTLTGVSKGLDVISVLAFRPSEFGSSVGTFRGDPAEQPNLKTYPVTRIVFEPENEPDWHIFVTMRAWTVGAHRLKGVEVEYTLDDRTLHELLHTGMEIKVVDCSLHPEEAPFVCSGSPEQLPSDRPSG